MTVKAIETRYNGYRFRSRLEARWAVFFENIGIKYKYETEGFDFGNGHRYLPDFWLPQVNLWAEVKACNPTADEVLSVIQLVERTGNGCLFLIDEPDVQTYFALELSRMPDASIGDLQPVEYILFSRYLEREHRFYCSPGDGLDGYEEEIKAAVHAARSARFEHGESGPG